MCLYWYHILEPRTTDVLFMYKQYLIRGMMCHRLNDSSANSQQVVDVPAWPRVRTFMPYVRTTSIDRAFAL